MRLSELKDTDMILVNEKVISKEKLINNFTEYKGFEVYTTKTYTANIDSMDMLDRALAKEDLNMHVGWYRKIRREITDEDVKDLQLILDRILSRSENMCYMQDEIVEIDM